MEEINMKELSYGCGYRNATGCLHIGNSQPGKDTDSIGKCLYNYCPRDDKQGMFKSIPDK